MTNLLTLILNLWLLPLEPVNKGAGRYIGICVPDFQHQGCCLVHLDISGHQEVACRLLQVISK